MSRSLGTLIVASTLVLVGCAAPKPTLRSDYDRSADFASYRTYGFVEPSGLDKAGYSTLLSQHFRDAVNAEMTARGYRHAADAPDLLVNCNANSREQVSVESRPTATIGYGYYGYRTGLYTAIPIGTTDVETRRYRVGTANVDVVDAKRRQVVWEGVAEGRLTQRELDDPGRTVRTVVRELFARFPGRAGAAQ